MVTYVVGAAAMVTAISILFTRLVRPVVKAIKKLIDVGEFIEELRGQFHPNGGTSLVDRLSRMEGQQADKNERLEWMVDRQSRLSIQVTDLQKQMEEILSLGRRPV